MTQWDFFFEEKIKRILNDKDTIIDIGGGLRVLREKGNVCSPQRQWIKPLLERKNYKILDPVPDYNPDIVGDIHNLPFTNNSQEAIICIAVLEHVQNPIKAVEEMYRVLKPGGYCFVYVPFLYCYHAMPGYYGDYWRFSKDTINYLFSKFSSLEKQNVRGACATWLRISPLEKFVFLQKISIWLDKLLGKEKSNQTSGYYIFCIK